MKNHSKVEETFSILNPSKPDLEKSEMYLDLKIQNKIEKLPLFSSFDFM